MIEKYLWITGSSIFVILGTIHLLYTFFTDKFSVRDKNTEEMMKKTFPVLTKKTTMWKAWVGFNASHSIGAVYLGIINLILAIWYFDFLTQTVALLLVTLLVSIFYLYLAARYWFRIPLTGIAITVICFVVAILLILMK